MQEELEREPCWPDGPKRQTKGGSASVETEIKFAGYLEQQKKSIEKLKAAKQWRFPSGSSTLDQRSLREMRETLERSVHHHRPGQPHSRRHAGRAFAGARFHSAAGAKRLASSSVPSNCALSELPPVKPAQCPRTGPRRLLLL